MNVHVCLWVTLGCLSAACFRDPELVQGALKGSKIQSLTVRDASGAAWPPEASPRRPTFELQLDRAIPQPEGALYLVPGSPAQDLLDDLSDPPLRQATQAVLLALEVQEHGSSVTARVSAALQAGRAYCLVWTGARELQLFPITISESAAAGAAFVAAWPAQDARDVPPNLAQILLRFDGSLAALPTARFLRADGPPLKAPQPALAPCAGQGLGAGDCPEIHLGTPLPTSQNFTLQFDADLHDATGSVVALPPLRFRTAAAPDRAAPELVSTRCAVDEQLVGAACVLASERSVQVRGLSSEAALVELLAPPARAAALAYSEPFSLELTPSRTPPSCVFLRLSDLAANRTELPICVELPSDLPTLSIDEVRVAPLGPEPDQEYVELLNFGTEPQPMNQLSLSTDAFTEGLPLESSDQLEPGERALVVGPPFDRYDTSDAPVSDAVKVVRLTRNLSLPNDGTELFLRDGRKRRVSASPKLAPARAGQCIARSGPDPRSGAQTEFALDPNGSCTPGAPTFGPSP